MNFYDKVHELVRNFKDTEEYKKYMELKKKVNYVTIFTCHLEKLSSDLEISLKLYLFKYRKIIIYIIFYKINIHSRRQDNERRLSENLRNRYYPRNQD